MFNSESVMTNSKKYKEMIKGFIANKMLNNNKASLPLTQKSQPLFSNPIVFCGVLVNALTPRCVKSN